MGIKWECRGDEIGIEWGWGGDDIVKILVGR